VEILDGVFKACGGARPVEQGEGDSTVCAFRTASEAARAAYAAQAALGDEPWQDGAAVRVRMAIHSGEAQARDDGTYAGVALNRCARLRSLAHGGQVLVSAATRDLVVDSLDPDLRLIDLGVHRLRDLSRPEHVWQLCGAGLVDEHPPLRSLEAAPNNLPVQLSSFIGREQQIEWGVALLGETRLLTLTGAGGCGKTRLAQRIAAEVVDRFSDGVWWAELASVTDERLVGDSVATTLGVKVPSGLAAAEVLASYFGAGSTLLVLDNCEHVVSGAAGFVDRLLRSNPTVRILATGREPLAIEGEVTWRVPSLDVPPLHRAVPDALEEFDAVRLFIERAVQARPDFRVTNDNAPAVAQICHRLDGIPLAIELAAARTRVFAPERIAVELDDRFRLLIGHRRVGVPRQQTLLASVGWSHDLLDAAERALLRRLGVFAGGFTLDAAEAVVSGAPLTESEMLEVLARLVDKSLVQPEDSTPSCDRYRLLETIRQYALERLSEAGEATAVRDRHLGWAGRLAAELEADVANAKRAALDRLDVEHANVRAGLQWAVAGQRWSDACALMAALGPFWAQRGHYGEARAWESRLLEQVDLPDDPSVARARWGCAYVRFYAGDFAGAYEQAAAALMEARATADASATARCL
jgi:predicted ATPase